jgi:HD-GYP domain-containing protein (c-di-GMP phosphodiesterase class II)
VAVRVPAAFACIAVLSWLTFLALSLAPPHLGLVPQEASASTTTAPATDRVRAATLPLHGTLSDETSIPLLAGMLVMVAVSIVLIWRSREEPEPSPAGRAPVGPRETALVESDARPLALPEPFVARSRERGEDPGAREETPPAAEELRARMEKLSHAIAALNVLGDTLDQSVELSDRLGRLAGRVRMAFAADAALIALTPPRERPIRAVSGDPHLRTSLIKACARAANGTATTIGARTTTTNAEGPVIFAVPLAVDGGLVGAVALARRDAACAGGADLALLTAVAGQLEMAVRGARMVRRLEATNLEMVQALATAMEAKDRYTATHAENIATMAVAVGRYLRLEEGELRELEYAAVLHDVGKIGVPGHILNKPDTLTALEYARVTQHTAIGERIVSRVDYLRPVARIIRAAHERWDGAGYPDGLAGEEIPLLARILFVCDAYDAMTSDRRYRKALPDEEALDELTAGAGTQFDPAIVDAFMAVIRAQAGMLEGAGEADGRSA